METRYLQEDCPQWNMVRGFENFNEWQVRNPCVTL